jgi:hypothetical protein
MSGRMGEGHNFRRFTSFVLSSYLEEEEKEEEEEEEEEEEGGGGGEEEPHVIRLCYRRQLVQE